MESVKRLWSRGKHDYSLLASKKAAGYTVPFAFTLVVFEALAGDTSPPYVFFGIKQDSYETTPPYVFSAIKEDSYQAPGYVFQAIKQDSYESNVLL